MTEFNQLINACEKCRKTALDEIDRLRAEVERYKTAIREATERYPYKISGKHETYSQYNEGWQAAVDFISTVSEDGEKLEG